MVVPGNFSRWGEWSPIGNLSATKTSSQDLLTNKDEAACESGEQADLLFHGVFVSLTWWTSTFIGCFRPVGLVFAHDGNRLYVSSDASGEVFLLQRDPELPSNSTGTTTRSGTGTATSGTSTPTRGSRPAVLNQRCRLKKKV